MAPTTRSQAKAASGLAGTSTKPPPKSSQKPKKSAPKSKKSTQKSAAAGSRIAKRPSRQQKKVKPRKSRKTASQSHKSKPQKQTKGSDISSPHPSPHASAHSSPHRPSQPPQPSPQPSPQPTAQPSAQPLTEPPTQPIQSKQATADGKFAAFESQKKQLDADPGWGVDLDVYLSLRTDLVEAILNRLMTNAPLVGIRATPLAGKTTLLHLLRLHILKTRPDLEPVIISWTPREDRGKGEEQHWTGYLRSAAQQYHKHNAASPYPRRNPDAKCVLLIDDAHFSYRELDFWNDNIKNLRTSSSTYFVLAYDFGSRLIEKISLTCGVYKSFALFPLAHDLWGRVDLFPPRPEELCVKFSQREIQQVLDAWESLHGLRINPKVGEYLGLATNGHPGVLGTILRILDAYLETTTQLPEELSSDDFHGLIANTDNFIDLIQTEGTGYWLEASESLCKTTLQEEHYQKVKYSEVLSALGSVAKAPYGVIHKESRELDAFAFCYLKGLLFPRACLDPWKGESTFVFPSPVHQRIAYERLFPSPDPILETAPRTLEEICLGAIERISLSALQSGDPHAFQEDFYYCLSNELRHPPILVDHEEFPKEKGDLSSIEGRIDYYIFKRWGIAVSQCPSVDKVVELARSFAWNDKYPKESVKFITLNFCTSGQVKKVDISHEDNTFRMMQIVVNRKKHVAEVYTTGRLVKTCVKLTEASNELSEDQEAKDDDPKSELKESAGEGTEELETGSKEKAAGAEKGGEVTKTGNKASTPGKDDKTSKNSKPSKK